MPIRAVLFLLLFGLTAHSHAEAAPGVGVGIQKLSVVDPMDGRPMAAAAVYPSEGRTSESQLGPYTVAGSRDAPMATGRYPVVVISHGTMGSMWGHHDLATDLAKSGVIAVVLNHPGDNFADPSRVGSTSSLYGRPMQASAVLTAVHNDQRLGPHADMSRVGFVGFSAGGTTGLIEAGAVPEPSLLKEYCAGLQSATPACETRGELKIDRADLKAAADPRFKALVLLAPLSVLFSPEQLNAVHVPTLTFVGLKDDELVPTANALALVRNLPSGPRLEVMQDASHFTFLAPCSEAMASEVPRLCKDAAGVDRAQLHVEMNRKIERFFTSALGVVEP